ncbi:MAG TPA: hypothetical protein DHV35_03290 [Halieaceae bacterium]|nr:hypothetical protein [Halieaceae bacterium]
MTVHLINQATRICSALPFLAPTDLVIVTDDRLTVQQAHSLTATDARVVMLEMIQRGDLANSTARFFDIITLNDWVRYTTTDDSVVSWG